MKTLLYVIKSLIQINFVIAVFSVFFVMAVRERKPETVLTSQPSDLLDTFRHEIKENLSDDQREILAYRQKIQQYEQAIKQQEAELEHYKAQKSLASTQSRQPSANSQQAGERAMAPFGNANPSLKSKRLTASANLSLPSSQQIEDRAAASGNANPSPRSQQPTTEAIAFQNTPVIPLSLAIVKTPSMGIVAGSHSLNLSSLQPTGQLSSPSPSTASENSQVSGTFHPASANSRLSLAQRGTDNHQAQVPSVTTHFDLSFNLLRPDLPKSLPNSQKIETRTTDLATTPAPPHKTAPANHLANDITMGLLIAGRKGHINYGTRTYRKVQTAIRFLRTRKSNDINEAARLAALSPDLLKRLAKSGKIRPGNLEKSPISLGIRPEPTK